jgi:hypothetical protein
MVCYPSFSGESCLSIHDDIPEEIVKKHGDRVLVPDNEKRFMITVTQASINFNSSLAENNKDKKAREVKVTRIDREISPQLAIATQRAWAQMLLRTKYPSKASMGFDGETYEFSVWIKGIGTLNGKTWSPQTGSTLQIVELGQALCALAADKKLEEAPLIKRLKEFEASMSSK